MLSLLEKYFNQGRVLWQQASQLQIVLVGVSLSILCVFISLHRLLKPVDKLPAPRGRAWKLPPGPCGLPFVGNLLLYGKGEDGVSSNFSARIV